jgi:hypothetical protein
MSNFKIHTEYRPKLPTLALPADCYDIVWDKPSNLIPQTPPPPYKNEILMPS